MRDAQTPEPSPVSPRSPEKGVRRGGPQQKAEVGILAQPSHNSCCLESVSLPLEPFSMNETQLGTELSGSVLSQHALRWV